MATKKTTKTAEILTPANTFEAELDLAINVMRKSAPEFTGALTDELAVLKERVMAAHKNFCHQESIDKDKELEDARQCIVLMQKDIDALKTTVLRMAINQYTS